MSGKPPRIPPKKYINNSTIIYIKNGKEKTITINKYNDNTICEKLTKYISQNKISSIHFKNYDLTNRFNYICSRDMDIILEDCIISNLEYRGINYLKIINPIIQNEELNIELDGIKEIDIDLQEPKTNIKLKINGCNKLNIISNDILQNIKLDLNYTKDIYLENLNLKQDLCLFEITRLFLKNCKFTLSTNDFFEIIDLISLNNSFINSSETLSLRSYTTLILNNSRITSKENISIGNINSIIFDDTNEDTILDISSYIEAKEIWINNYIITNKKNKTVILDKTKQQELLPNIFYIKNNKSYNYKLPNNNINPENKIFIKLGYELYLKDDIELIYIKNGNFSNININLNEEQIIILENCYLDNVDLINGNIEIINNNHNIYNSSSFAIDNANDVIISLSKDSNNYDIEVINTKNFTLNSDITLNNLTLNNVEKAHLKNISNGIDYLDCKYLIIENSNDLELYYPENEIDKVKKLTIINSTINNYSKNNFYIKTLEELNLNNSKIFSDTTIFLPNLKNINLNESIISSLQNINLPNIDTITTTDSIKGLSYFKVGKELTIGSNAFELPEKIDIVRNDIELKRIILLNLLSNLKNKITTKIDETIKEEESILINEIEQELGLKKSNIKTKMLSKKEEQLNKSIIDLN